MSIEDIEKDIAEINKRFGNNSIMLATFMPKEKISVIPTGSIGLDFKTGVGGIPIGKVTVIKGQPSVGKSTLCLHLTANAQKEGGLVAYIDGEHELDINYAINLGVDINNLLISQPDTMEQGLEILEHLTQLNKFKLIIFDSIAAIPTEAEASSTIKDLQTADKARLLSKHARKMNSYINKTSAAIVYINQYRDNISFGYASGKIAPGGHAMDFRAALIIELSKITSEVKVGTQPIGSRIRAKILKNKLARPYGTWEFTIKWGEGIVEEHDLIELALSLDIIKQKGAWYSFEDLNIGQGIWGTAENLKSDAELYKKIKDAVFLELKVE
jgi:recombination protein RecA